jgi:NTP pyrophosphatase (non-canonical NTP hydrolase)
MLSFNYLAKKALEIATKRGKVDSRTTDMEQIAAIRAELAELADATEKKALHLPCFTEQEEEAADVIIATLTYLARKNVDVDLLLISKMSYNANRE